MLRQNKFRFLREQIGHDQQHHTVQSPGVGVNLFILGQKQIVNSIHRGGTIPAQLNQLPVIMIDRVRVLQLILHIDAGIVGIYLEPRRASGKAALSRLFHCMGVRELSRPFFQMICITSAWLLPFSSSIRYRFLMATSL